MALSCSFWGGGLIFLLPWKDVLNMQWVLIFNLTVGKCMWSAVPPTHPKITTLLTIPLTVKEARQVYLEKRVANISLDPQKVSRALILSYKEEWSYLWCYANIRACSIVQCRNYFRQDQGKIKATFLWTFYQIYFCMYYTRYIRIKIWKKNHRWAKSPVWSNNTLVTRVWNIAFKRSQQSSYAQAVHSRF